MLKAEITTFQAVSSSEEQIISLLVTDRKKAIRLIYDHYGDTLYGVVCTMTGDEEAAKDILQESLLKVWQRALDYDKDKARLFTWLLRITRNAAIDRMRADGRRQDHMIQKQLEDVYKVERPINPDHLDIAQHVSQLDERYGKVIHALFFLGLTQEEASKALDLPLGTIKSRLRIGLRELRKVYGDPLILWIILTLWNK
ncbi:MAG: sigma-70 family RNA polymerase sigma factor [Flavobacteriales bacterium]|nr:sigma-70 family RNA polymerase sigma factor [Flavobacteriales bacterium]